MKSLNKILLEKLVAHRPSRALRLSAERLGIIRVTLRLPQGSPLFRRDDGEILELPLDMVIAPQVLDHGCWQMEEINFVAAHAPKQPLVLFDIGANIGLMTRQLMHALPSIVAAVCYEPHPLHFQLLSRNLAHLQHCRLVQAAAGAAAGQMSFYEDMHNMGNYSLNIDAMRGREYRTSIVECVRAHDEEFLSRLSPETAQLPIIWKSDTQGCDETIVTSLSDDFWSPVPVAVMEISRINRPKFDAARLSSILELFPIRRFGSRSERLSVKDV
jgi:FkbM family methyltransferase